MTLKEAIEKFRERCENNPQYKEMIEKLKANAQNKTETK